MLDRPSSHAQESPNAAAQIEDYLDKVCVPLIDELPYAARQELRREVGAHLRSLIAAYVETGTAPQDALTMALDKFGDPAFVAAQWRPKLRRVRPVSWLRSQRQGIAATLAAGAVVALVLMTTLPKNQVVQNGAAQPGSVSVTAEAVISTGRPFRHTDAVNRGMACQDCHRSNVNRTSRSDLVIISDGRIRVISEKAIKVVVPSEIRYGIRVGIPNGIRGGVPGGVIHVR